MSFLAQWWKPKMSSDTAKCPLAYGGKTPLGWEPLNQANPMPPPHGWQNSKRRFGTLKVWKKKFWGLTQVIQLVDKLALEPITSQDFCSNLKLCIGGLLLALCELTLHQVLRNCTYLKSSHARKTKKRHLAENFFHEKLFPNLPVIWLWEPNWNAVWTSINCSGLLGERQSVWYEKK